LRFRRCVVTAAKLSIARLSGNAAGALASPRVVPIFAPPQPLHCQSGPRSALR
jgi:hypothetical protein